MQFVWDSTSIKLGEECLRKYQYKMIEGWTSRRLSVHLRFGAHYATALEHFYKHVANGMSIDNALECVVEEALIDTWDRPTCTTCEGTGRMNNTLGGVGPSAHHEFDCPDCDGNGIAGPGAPWDSGDNLKTRENLIRTIIWYVDQFANENTKVVTLSNGAPAVELSFTLPVDDGIYFAGHLDRLVEYAHDPYVMDQKTTKTTISSHYFNGYSPDIQMSMYTFAGRVIYNAPIKGVIIDAAQIAVGFSRFERGFTFRTEGQLNEWYDETLARIERVRSATANANFPMNTASCGNYGGCEFRDVCSRSPEVRRNFLAANFDQRPTWDPLDRR